MCIIETFGPHTHYIVVVILNKMWTKCAHKLINHV